MVKIGLQLKVFLENVTGLTPDGEDFRCESVKALLDKSRCVTKVVSQAQVCQLWRGAQTLAVRRPDRETAAEGRPRRGLCCHKV